MLGTKLKELSKNKGEDPDVLAEEIIENLQSGIESFKEIMLSLKD